MTEKEENKKILDNILANSNLLPLAFIGDSIHTLYVREQVLQNENLKLQNYHQQAAKFCKASAQANALNNVLPLLNEIELNIVKRARNAHPKHTAKNATSADYSYATAFEALVGYLYLISNKERLQKILELSTKGENL